MRQVFATLSRCLAQDPAVALVTVVDARGSTPREAGARMVVTIAGDIAGTIGGGRLELEAIDAAKALVAAGRDTFETRRFALGPSLGQCCGGTVTLGIEVVTAARKAEMDDLAAREAEGGLTTRALVRTGAPVVRTVLPFAGRAASALLTPDGALAETFAPKRRSFALFGAGHVGRALVFALAPLPFDILWVDERREMFPSHVPSSVEIRLTRDPAGLIPDLQPGAFVAIMTHDHEIDLAILHACLSGERPAYVGLIGSATKRARFESRLKDLGVPSHVSSQFRCPIGVPGIGSKEPALIAAAVAAELLIEDEKLQTQQMPADRRRAAIT